MNEHELAYRYLPEWYKYRASCDIHQLDCWAVLNIIANFSAFASEVRTQAAEARAVRKRWERGIVE